MINYFCGDELPVALGMLLGIGITHPEYQDLLKYATHLIDDHVNELERELEWYQKNTYPISNLLEISYDQETDVFHPISLSDLDITKEMINEWREERERFMKGEEKK